MTDADVPVHESYDRYQPPLDVRRLVIGYLRSVPRHYLVGIQSFVLTNTPGGVPRQLDAETCVGGLYHRRTARVAAWIEIFIDAILNDVPAPVLKIGVLRDLRIAPRVFHEIGHHIDLSSGTQSRDIEAAAEKWKRKLLARFFRRRYWYLLPVLAPVAIIRRLAKRRPASS